MTEKEKVSVDKLNERFLKLAIHKGFTLITGLFYELKDKTPVTDFNKKPFVLKQDDVHVLKYQFRDVDDVFHQASIKLDEFGGFDIVLKKVRIRDEKVLATEVVNVQKTALPDFSRASETICIDMEYQIAKKIASKARNQVMTAMKRKFQNDSSSSSQQTSGSITPKIGGISIGNEEHQPPSVINTTVTDHVPMEASAPTDPSPSPLPSTSSTQDENVASISVTDHSVSSENFLQSLADRFPDREVVSPNNFVKELLLDHELVDGLFEELTA